MRRLEINKWCERIIIMNFIKPGDLGGTSSVKTDDMLSLTEVPG